MRKLRRVEYYDEDMRLAKVMTMDRIIETSGRKVASHMVMINKKKPGQQTEVTYHVIKFDVSIPADTFTHRNLTRGVR